LRKSRIASVALRRSRNVHSGDVGVVQALRVRTVVDVRAETCRECGAVFRGDITLLAQRLEADERLDDSGDSP
jgi:hypothetical protein